MPRTLALDPGLDKLQAVLLEMAPGDELSLPDAMKMSGLQAVHCEAVLDALARAGLMTRTAADAYVRCHLAG